MSPTQQFAICEQHVTKQQVVVAEDHPSLEGKRPLTTGDYVLIGRAELPWKVISVGPYDFPPIRQYRVDVDRFEDFPLYVVPRHVHVAQIDVSKTAW
jgi:hypothetical protein